MYLIFNYCHEEDCWFQNDEGNNEAGGQAYPADKELMGDEMPLCDDGSLSLAYGKETGKTQETLLDFIREEEVAIDALNAMQFQESLDASLSPTTTNGNEQINSNSLDSFSKDANDSQDIVDDNIIADDENPQRLDAVNKIGGMFFIVIQVNDSSV